MCPVVLPKVFGVVKDDFPYEAMWDSVEGSRAFHWSGSTSAFFGKAVCFFVACITCVGFYPGKLYAVIGW